MEAKFIKPGEDTDRWCWAQIEENGSDGKPFGTWCHKLREPASFCSMCSKKLLYSSSGRKVLARHECESQSFGLCTVSYENSCHCAFNDQQCLQPKNMFVHIHGRRKYFISIKLSSHFKLLTLKLLQYCLKLPFTCILQ